MPLDRLEKHILESARGRADAIKGDANQQAERILAEARTRARAIESEAEKATKAEIARREAEQLEGVELQERAALLEARNKAVEAAMSKLKRLVAKRVGKKGLERIIADAIGEASGIAPQEELTLVIGRNDAKLVKGFGGRIKYGSMGNGVELRNKNGSVRITATVEGLFEERRQEIETMLLREAFPKRKRSGGKGKRK